MNYLRIGWLCALLPVIFAAGAQAGTCPAEPPLENWTGGGATACPCFIPGELAGVVLGIPAGDLPVEILKVRIAWGSLFGGAPDSLEQAIRIYEGGLPNPGAPIFSIDGPALVDGVINEFDLEPLPGEIIVNSSPVMVALEFFNQNAGSSFAPTVVHDGNGCQAGRNAVFTIPGGWNDACLLGVTGDWVMSVVYRKIECGLAAGAGSVPDADNVPGTPLEIDKFGAALLLSWQSSCVATDVDYAIYEGQISDFTSHSDRFCSSGGALGSVVVPAAGSSYYLVVPLNDDAEGSYGTDSAGAERPPGTSQCKTQITAACD